MASELEGYYATLRRTDTAMRKYDGLQDQHFNKSLRAPNVWEVDLPLSVINEAHDIFRANGLGEAFLSLKRSDACHAQVGAGVEGGRFFLLRSAGVGSDGTGMGGRSSDITWISVDDERSYDRLQGLFSRLGLESVFDGVVHPWERLRMYSAYFVVRSCCEEPHLHFDYPEEVGTKALTLMTPLAVYRVRSTFNLIYRQQPLRKNIAGGDEYVAGGDERYDECARYEYKVGTGIVFGASFQHSTEPGRAHPVDGMHVYLCFTFGTDRQQDWPMIFGAVGGNQSRVVCTMEGQLVLTKLGRRLLDEANAS